jgi:hypothetical protein
VLALEGAVLQGLGMGDFQSLGDFGAFIVHAILFLVALYLLGLVLSVVRRAVLGPVPPSPPPPPRDPFSPLTKEEIRAAMRVGCTHLNATFTQSGSYSCGDCGLNAVQPGQRGAYGNRY